MGKTGGKCRSGKNSQKYLMCKEWIDWEVAQHIGALEELDKLREHLDERYDS